MHGMTLQPIIALTLAGVLALCVSVTAQRKAVAPEIGWIGLFNLSLVEWLENENQLKRLCAAFKADTSEWFECRNQQLAPKVHVIQLRMGPSEKAAPAGALVVVAVPGQGMRSFFAPAAGGAATEFRPDLYDGDWGYGPYFHETFLERRGAWFRLPEVPFPKGAWIDSTKLSPQPELRLLADEHIVTSPVGDLFILGLERGLLRARLEQEADMWCAEKPPPLRPWRELRIPLRDLYTPTGHLTVHTKYTRGC